MEAIPEIKEKAEEIGLSGPVFSLGTANSACSAAFYARISGIREYPLKYTDPDGRMQRKDGKLIFTPIVNDTMVHSNYTASGKTGLLYADNGIPVGAYENWSHDVPELNTNCHGKTFADGEFWINDPQPILDGDGYQLIENISEARVGDVVIYKDRNQQIVHSATITGVEKKIPLFGFIPRDPEITVYGLSGIEIEAYETDIRDAPFNIRYDQYEIYRKE
jgi:hypothetical protein